MAADHDHVHVHGHQHDQGIRGALRYLRWLPEMWRSAVNDAAVAVLAPRPGERVVDIGAGLGAGSTRVAGSGAHAIAVEPTPFMRRLLAARRVVGRHGAGLEVVDGAAERIPVDDAVVDAVLAVNTMHHWVDVDRGVAEIARILRPDGRLFLVDEDFDDPTHPEHERFAHDGDHEHHGFTMVDADEMGDRFRAVGMSDVDARRIVLAGRPAIAVSRAIATAPIGDVAPG